MSSGYLRTAWRREVNCSHGSFKALAVLSKKSPRDGRSTKPAGFPVTSPWSPFGLTRSWAAAGDRPVVLCSPWSMLRSPCCLLKFQTIPSPRGWLVFLQCVLWFSFVRISWGILHLLGGSVALWKEPKLAPQVPRFRACCWLSVTELASLAVQSSFYLAKTGMKWLYMENSYLNVQLQSELKSSRYYS